MKDYKIMKHPITGDVMWMLSYSEKDFELVKKFIDENYHETYTISFYDNLTGKTLEIINSIKEIKNDIKKIVSEVSEKEHTFIRFIGVNSFSDSYVIGIDFTRGYFSLPNICIYKDGKISKI